MIGDRPPGHRQCRHAEPGPGSVRLRNRRFRPCRRAPALIKVGAMERFRQLTVCCIALVLLGAALPAPALVATADATAPDMPCHMDAGGPVLHDDECAIRCESAPAGNLPGPDWAPASLRQTDDERDSGHAVTALACGQSSRLHTVLSRYAPRAPPTPGAATPVARHDVQRD